MRPDDSDKSSDSDWDDPSELDWSEFDWEKYLREQDEVLLRYLGFYGLLRDHPQRLDEVAKLMGWDVEAWNAALEEDDEEEDETDETPQPYTLQKNPVYVATQALFLSLTRPWEILTEKNRQLVAADTMPYLSALYRSQQQCLHAVQALDFGDFTMAVSLLKRTLRELNDALARLPQQIALPDYPTFREDATRRLFDLREVCLRVMGECRYEATHPADSEEDEEK